VHHIVITSRSAKKQNPSVKLVTTVVLTGRTEPQLAFDLTVKLQLPTSADVIAPTPVGSTDLEDCLSTSDAA